MPSVELDIGGKRLLLEGERFTLGRGLECDVMLKSTRVSRRHAMLVFIAGRWLARDLESANGTFLNRRTLVTDDIRAGDVLKFGDGGPRVRIISLDPAPIDPNLRLDVQGDTDTSLERELTESTGR